jgi:cell division topological specificity factor
MGLLDLFRKPPRTASVAKERLRIIVAQERSARGSGTPDYLPLLRRELLDVIIKYVNVDASAVQVNFGRESGHEVLEFSVALPGAAKAPLSAAKRS